MIPPRFFPKLLTEGELNFHFQLLKARCLNQGFEKKNCDYEQEYYLRELINKKITNVSIKMFRTLKPKWQMKDYFGVMSSTKLKNTFQVVITVTPPNQQLINALSSFFSNNPFKIYFDLIKINGEIKIREIPFGDKLPDLIDSHHKTIPKRKSRYQFQLPATPKSKPQHEFQLPPIPKDQLFCSTKPRKELMESSEDECEKYWMSLSNSKKSIEPYKNFWG